MRLLDHVLDDILAACACVQAACFLQDSCSTLATMPNSILIRRAAEPVHSIDEHGLLIQQILQYSRVAIARRQMKRSSVVIVPKTYVDSVFHEKANMLNLALSCIVTPVQT